MYQISGSDQLLANKVNNAERAAKANDQTKAQSEINDLREVAFDAAPPVTELGRLNSFRARLALFALEERRTIEEQSARLSLIMKKAIEPPEFEDPPEGATPEESARFECARLQKLVAYGIAGYERKHGRGPRLF